MDSPNFQCGMCAESFGDREHLMAHNVEMHDMGADDSRRAVMEKYPAR